MSYLLETPFKYYDDVIVNKNCGMRYSFAKYTDPHRDLIVPQGMTELRDDGKVHQIVDSLLGLQQPSKPTFTGPVYILIDGGCLSTTPNVVKGFSHSDNSSKNLYRPRDLTVSMKVASLAVRGCV